ncbi:hypothetical protein TEA_017109 [Camellia sinensis var. sinensis]|uniref:Uncharacterized protein n=1 Tax=Camellia sinensis var. sinensis TaxID=542762 RepID=A0A4S4D9T4_CAMSN|nr:hypothetical protein TEA_017109 [Camellia sinensis var. sinensis]
MEFEPINIENEVIEFDMGSGEEEDEEDADEEEDEDDYDDYNDDMVDHSSVAHNFFLLASYQHSPCWHYWEKKRTEARKKLFGRTLAGFAIIELQTSVAKFQLRVLAFLIGLGVYSLLVSASASFFSTSTAFFSTTLAVAFVLAALRSETSMELRNLRSESSKSRRWSFDLNLRWSLDMNLQELRNRFDLNLRSESSMEFREG